MTNLEAQIVTPFLFQIREISKSFAMKSTYVMTTVFSKVKGVRSDLNHLLSKNAWQPMRSIDSLLTFLLSFIFLFAALGYYFIHLHSARNIMKKNQSLKRKLSPANNIGPLSWVLQCFIQLPKCFTIIN